MIRGLLPWFVLAGVLGAQRPARPALGPGQDTNSADAYVALGISQMMDHPKVAAAAFFWATRLDPANGDAWYGRWAARLLDPDTPPPGSFRTPGGFEISAPELQDPDSFRIKALLRNPLLYVRFDFPVADELMRRESQGQMSLYGTDDLDLRGKISYATGRFAEAVELFGQALREHPGHYGLRLERARAYIMLGELDQAEHELDRYNVESAHVKKKSPISPDESGVMMIYALARLEEVNGELGTALGLNKGILIADSNFTMSHAALSRIVLTHHDTATALQELGRAAVVPDGPICYDYAVLLLGAGHPREAALQLNRSIAADSDYAKPYYLLAVLDEQAGFDSEAIGLFTRFIAGAPRTLDVSVADARGRLARLQGRARQN